MAAEYRHKRYFRVRVSDSSLDTFSSTADANTKIGFTSVYSTSSPTKTEALADSDKTLVVTYEFNDESEQTAFKSAVDSILYSRLRGPKPALRVCRQVTRRALRSRSRTGSATAAA